MGRTARGVKGIGLRDGDAVVGALLIRREATVLTITEDGWGKRTDAAEYPLQKRGGLGTLSGSSGVHGGTLVCALEVVEEDEVMLVADSGQVTRVAAEDVSVLGRRTRGNRLVGLAKGQRLVEVTRSQGGRKPDEGSGGAQDAEQGVPDGTGEPVPGGTMEAVSGGTGEAEPRPQLDLLGKE